jgi:hypothetical protein
MRVTSPVYRDSGRIAASYRTDANAIGAAVSKTKALSASLRPAEYRKWMNDNSISVSKQGFSDRQSST